MNPSFSVCARVCVCTRKVIHKCFPITFTMWFRCPLIDLITSEQLKIVAGLRFYHFSKNLKNNFFYGA